MKATALESQKHAAQEKKLVALSSVLAAVFLTGMKIAVGITTGSLGILAEAAHSALDLVAALITFLAVRVSGKPADREHTYGHGKIENLSALFEVLLLLLTAGWIIYESIERLFFRTVHVDANIWAFLVMLISIIIDYTRSRALMRVARKYQSQALEADALHFSTDIWSSAVVIGGLFLILLSDRLAVGWLRHADAVAAIIVAAIVIYVSTELGKKTLEGLLDAVPTHLRDEIIRAVQLPGVIEVKQVRARQSGPEAFVDFTLTLARDLPLEQAHAVADQAEDAVRKILPDADVVVHIDPVKTRDEGIVQTVRLLAAKSGHAAHDIVVIASPGKTTLELHLEVNQSLQVVQAHTQASELEAIIRQALPKIDEIITHLEPAGEEHPVQTALQAEEESITAVINNLPELIESNCKPHSIEARRIGGELFVSFHCTLAADMAITNAHLLTEKIEKALRQKIANLGRVLIHIEPENHAGEGKG